MAVARYHAAPHTASQGSKAPSPSPSPSASPHLLPLPLPRLVPEGHRGGVHGRGHEAVHILGAPLHVGHARHAQKAKAGGQAAEVKLTQPAGHAVVVAAVAVVKTVLG